MREHVVPRGDTEQTGPRHLSGWYKGSHCCRVDFFARKIHVVRHTATLQKSEKCRNSIADRDSTGPRSQRRVLSQHFAWREAALMVELEKPAFDAAAFLATAGLGRKIVQLKRKETFFAQGEPADSVFYLQKGQARVTVVSKAGKEATITLLNAGDFVGEEALAGSAGLRLTTATAITACTALKIRRSEMIRVMHEEHEFSDLFLKFLLERSMRIQADLVDQLFNSSEKRLARILLLMAEFGKPGERETLIPKISQQTLAEMIGTTRSRVSFFMNRFRKLGFISYNGRIRVHKSLLNVILHDQTPNESASEPGVPEALGQ